jgi:hypothetical protein
MARPRPSGPSGGGQTSREDRAGSGGERRGSPPENVANRNGGSDRAAQRGPSEPVPAGGSVRPEDRSAAGREAATAGDATSASPSRPRTDNPRVGTAVPRPPSRPPQPDRNADARGGNSTARGSSSYRGSYFYSRGGHYDDRGGYYGGFYPWGFGGIGLGYYYDPWGGYYDSWGGGAYSPGYGQSAYRYEGSLRLRVSPRDASVYVDGYEVGIVDDFDGIFQRLRVEAGPHRIEVLKPGFEPLVFEVLVQPNHPITCTGEMRRLP